MRIRVDLDPKHCCYITVLSSKIWQELELELKLWTKVEPESEPKINNFGSATLS